jgi:hypothetical protein
MRCFWEQTGVLGPIYRGLGQGLNDDGIARKLNLTELTKMHSLDTSFSEPEKSSRAGRIRFICA